MVIEVVLGNTADGEERLLTANGAADIDAWCHCCDVGAVLESQRLDLSACIGGDGNADILDELLPLLGGDDDFF